MPGRDFDRRISSPEPHAVALLGEIDGMRGEFKAASRMSALSEAAMRRSALVASAAASTRIEGSRLSDREVGEILAGLSAVPSSDRDFQEARGYLETLGNVFSGYDRITLRESAVRSLHASLLKYSDKDAGHMGRYKKVENAVGPVAADGKMAKALIKMTPARLAGNETTELVEWANAALEGGGFHPLLVIANFVVELLKIHPFEDGNGRLSRVLTNLLLLRAGYGFVRYVSHERAVERRKEEYYLALRASQETFGTGRENVAPWLNFFLSCLRGQAKAAVAAVGPARKTDSLSPKRAQVLGYLSTVREAGPNEISKATGVVLPTVRQSLGVLVEEGLAKMFGKGRATRYSATGGEGTK